MMGGVVELVARLSVAMIAMRVHSYALSCFCDPAAWLSAGLFYRRVLSFCNERRSGHLLEPEVSYGSAMTGTVKPYSKYR